MPKIHKSMNLSINSYALNTDCTKISATNLSGEVCELDLIEFFDWFTDWSNDQGHGVFSHDAERQTITRTYSEIYWDADREEPYTSQTCTNDYSYVNFFHRYEPQVKDILTRYTQSLEDIVWVRIGMAA